MFLHLLCVVLLFVSDIVKTFYLVLVLSKPKPIPNKTCFCLSTLYLTTKTPTRLVHIAVYDLLKFCAFCVFRSQSQAAKQQNTKIFSFLFFLSFALIDERVNYLTLSDKKVCWGGTLNGLNCLRGL